MPANSFRAFQSRQSAPANLGRVGSSLGSVPLGHTLVVPQPQAL